MSRKYKQKGFSVVEIFAVVVIVALIGSVGYRVYSSRSTDESNETAQSESTTEKSSEVIESKDDLNEATKNLQEKDIDTENDENQLQELVN